MQCNSISSINIKSRQIENLCRFEKHSRYTIYSICLDLSVLFIRNHSLVALAELLRILAFSLEVRLQVRDSLTALKSLLIKEIVNL